MDDAEDIMLSGKSQSQKVKYVPSVLFTQLCPTLRPHGLWPRQAPLFTGFFRQEYWSGLPCPPPGDLSNPGIEPRSPTLWVDSSPSEPPGKPKNIGMVSLSLLQGIFQPRNWTSVSCIEGGYFSSWATREAQSLALGLFNWGMCKVLFFILIYLF